MLDFQDYIHYILCSLESEVEELTPMGRPRLKDPIKSQITVRMTKSVMERLEAYCEENKITKGEAVRKGVEELLAKKK